MPSYIAKWTFNDLRAAGANLLESERRPLRSTSTRFYEQFCASAGVDDVPISTLTSVSSSWASEVRAKLGSVALWLREHKVDIKVIEIEVTGKAVRCCSSLTPSYRCP
jgi:hypothetical protein